MISVVIPHYNASDILSLTVDRVMACASLAGASIELVVVDDGSCEQHRSSFRDLESRGTRIVPSEQNLGRSGAVNLGVSVAAYDLVLILDCDCQPGTDRFFFDHLQAIADADVSLGGLLKLKDDFWGRYQDIAVERRVRQFNAGMPFFFTTPNVLIRKHVFQSVGGYDEAYRHYGFEDRDLLIRLQEAGARFAYSPGSSVIHCDTRISLMSVARKMHEAGRYTSGIFSARHPEAYRSLGYSRVDVGYHPALKLFSGIDAEWLARRVEPWLEKMPFALGAAAARSVSALAYLRGTAEAASAADSDQAGSVSGG